MSIKDHSKSTHVSVTSLDIWLTVAVVMSLLGLAIHNLQEFGVRGVIAFDLGMIPMLVLQITILLIWLFNPKRRKTMIRWLLFCAVLHLVIGAFLTVLPLGFLPFEPEQTMSHYITHVIYGLLQLPLLLVTIRLLRHF